MSGPPAIDAWQPWTPQEVVQALAGVDVPWCVVGGWAIDLFLGRSTRHHEDIEIAVPAIAFAPIRERLQQQFTLYAAGDGVLRRLWPADPFPKDKFQCWVLDEAAQAWRLDVMQEPGDAEQWVYRRDPRITAPRIRMSRVSADGIPYLAPEAALFFKAKRETRPKDEADFANCRDALSSEARAWLRDTLSVVQPGHPWLNALT